MSTPIILTLILLLIALGATWFFVLKKDGVLSEWTTTETCPKCGDTETERTFKRTYTPPKWFGAEHKDNKKLEDKRKCSVRPCAAKGRYIRIEQSTEVAAHGPIINLSWLKVYTKDKEGKDILISKDKPITASSILPSSEDNFGAENLHIYTSTSKYGNIFHSNTGSDKKNNIIPWVELDLEKEYTISKIEVQNRTGHKSRIVDAEVFILDSDKKVDWKGKFEDSKDLYTFEGMQWAQV